MYDQSLEQLIDAVIADGIISDQERKVVYKKAASLGIDQDEIEVYLEGRLQKVKKEAAPKSGKHGVVKTCPNCGAPIVAGMAKCPDCGFAYMGVEANSSVKELDRRLNEVTGDNVFVSAFAGENTKKSRIIESFPIPNSREDLVEFLTYLEPKTRDKSFEQEAYIQKFEECLNKMKVSFPDDPIYKEYEGKLKKNKKSEKKSVIKDLFTLILFLAIIGTGLYAVVRYSSGKEAERTEYVNNLIDKINALPTPSVDNYQDCYRQFTKVIYSEINGIDEDSPKFKAFVSVKNSYSNLLRNAYIAAGVPIENIPDDINSDNVKGSSAETIEDVADNSTEESSESTEEPLEGLTEESPESTQEGTESNIGEPLEETPDTYAQALIAQIQALPAPDTKNYLECYNKFSNIRWTKKFDDQRYANDSFAKAKAAYAKLLKKAYADAGVDYEYIPSEISSASEYNFHH